MRAFFHILIPLVILSLGFGAFVGLKGLKKMGFKLNNDDKASSKMRSGAKEKPKIQTRVIALEKKDYTVQIQSQGMIRTHNATTLTAQVSGRVARLSPHFEDGAYFNKGDILLEIDKADYLTDRESSRAQVARMEAAYAQELARAKQALLNWREAGFTEDASDLVLRKPQLREAEANVNSAKSSLERAERNLTRTQVKAPYDGRVRKRNVGLGQQVGASTPLGEIFSTDFAEVRLPLTTRDLTYYTPPNKPEETSTLNKVSFSSILTPNTEGAPPQWEGEILRAEGELDSQSRQLFIIARIDDPFGLTSEKPGLFIGQPVRALIPAQILKEVYTIPRSALSELNEILVIRDKKLKRVNIAPIWSTEDHVIIRDGLEPNDLVTTTQLRYAPEGAEVEIITNPVDTEPSQLGTKRRVGHKGGHGH